MEILQVSKVELARALKATREVLADLDAENGVTHRLDLGYSGRKMSGGRCVGLVTDQPGTAVVFGHYLARELGEGDDANGPGSVSGYGDLDVLPQLSMLSIDSFGHKVIAYWTELVHDPEADERAAEDVATEMLDVSDVEAELAELGGLPELTPA